jgi:hypothetical protein
VTPPTPGSAAAVVASIQRHLEAIYAVEAGQEIHRFLVGDDHVEALVHAGVIGEERRGADEQVLLLQGGGGGVEIALHLADDVQAALGAGASLQDHCHATEGVSHVLLLLYSAQRRQSLRLLDLELQAEVDKAATCLLLARGTPGSPRAHVWLRRLFGSAEFAETLTEPERERYREAHRLGARYAEHLATLLGDGVDALLGELRRFYRLPADGKRERARAA